MTSDTMTKVREVNVRQIFAGDGICYRIPRYQREYAWGDLEISTMMTDLWESFKKDPRRNYYLGTLVVCPKENGLEVIDGQQRLTTLSLLMSAMGVVRNRPVVSFVNRKYADDFLNMLCTGERGVIDKALENARERSELRAFASAVSNICSFSPSNDKGDVIEQTLLNLLNHDVAGIKFRDFILDKVCLFEVTMPTDTDAMSYFEVMNNRGEQLALHELFKARLLWKLHNIENDPGRYSELSRKFDRLWTACSSMDGHLIDHLHACYDLQDNGNLSWTDLECPIGSSDQGDDSSGDVQNECQSVIGDFANFLMHVLRLYFAKSRTSSEDKHVPLDERKLTEYIDKVDQSIDPIRFLDLLLRTRLTFDKYVVKAEMINGKVSGWSIHEIVKGNYYAKDTYRERFGDSCQNALVKLESALQVSNATQRYKEWVYEILAADESERVEPSKLIKKLECYAARRIAATIRECEERGGDDYYKQGVGTPRLTLNIIDYLMWKKSEEGGEGCRGFAGLPDFVFTYQNSVEHHHSQTDNTASEQWTREQIDDIGNLYLTSSSENSSMWKHNARDKVYAYLHDHGDTLPSSPKRHWMYKRSRDVGDWKWDDAEDLSNYVQGLLNDFLRSNG